MKIPEMVWFLIAMGLVMTLRPQTFVSKTLPEGEVRTQKLRASRRTGFFFLFGGLIMLVAILLFEVRGVSQRFLTIHFVSRC